MDTVFRLAVMDDLPALLALELRCFATDRLSRRSFRRMIERAHGQLRVIESEGQLLGYALVLFRRGTSSARLYSIAIAGTARGGGWGKRLLQHVEACAAEHGCTHLRLEVRIDNPVAIALYERNGYRRFGLIHDYYEDHTDALRMQKPLP
ncbi:GNAT family N-acetyltransferase [Pseudomonas sp. COW3]|nr:GNAT family N-acetyltransferase [Pseudomonas botevensis]